MRRLSCHTTKNAVFFAPAGEIAINLFSSMKNMDQKSFLASALTSQKQFAQQSKPGKKKILVSKRINPSLQKEQDFNEFDHMVSIAETNSASGETFGSLSVLNSPQEANNEVEDQVRHLLHPKPLPRNFKQIDDTVRKSQNGEVIRRSVLG